MKGSFEIAYKHTNKHEGGYTRGENDPGGETYRGIARNRWPQWDGWIIVDGYRKVVGFPKNLDTNMILQSKIQNFYFNNFWLTMNSEKISDSSQPLATDLYDMAVNLGVGRASMYFQRGLNALNDREKLYKNIKVDGDIGPRTLFAFGEFLKHRKVELLYKAVNILQGCHYVSLMEANEDKEQFWGWFERVTFI